MVGLPQEVGESSPGKLSYPAIKASSLVVNRSIPRSSYIARRLIG